MDSSASPASHPPARGCARIGPRIGRACGTRAGRASGHPRPPPPRYAPRVNSTQDAAPLYAPRCSEVRGERLALCLLWSREEAHRIGEIVLPEPAPAVLGRGSGPNHLGLGRARPGTPWDPSPLQSPRISRDQLRIGLQGEALRVENLGRCRLLQHGVAVTDCLVQAGDTLLLEDEALFGVVRRPWPPAAPAQGLRLPRFPFGEADEDGIVGESPAAWGLRATLALLGPRPAHVLVRGESGTGKELVARGLHRRSPRAALPLIARNAATIPSTLVDAELFGNARNYPNPGMAERPGLIGEADGSSLFLDEFAELPIEAQAHLLRVLDQGEYHRLGEAKARRADLRLIAATNRPESAIKHDVLARMPLRVELPPLHARPEDVPLLLRHLLRRITTKDPALAAQLLGPDGEARTRPALIEGLCRWPWTTHVRELEQLLWRSIAEATDGLLDWPRGLRPTVAAPLEPARAVDPEGLDPVEVQAVLDQFEGQQEPAWRALGLASRHVLARFVKKHGLRVRGRRSGGEP